MMEPDGLGLQLQGVPRIGGEVSIESFVLGISWLLRYSNLIGSDECDFAHATVSR